MTPDKFAIKSYDEKAAAEEKLKEIGEAYEVLKDAKLEQCYDSGAGGGHHHSSFG